MKIPLVDLSAQYGSIKPEVDAAIQRVISVSGFIGGAEVAGFEREFASYCGVPFCAGVGNGTDALFLALKALGIGPGDEVVTVALTFIATAEAVTAAGAAPVFVDVREDTLLMNPDLLARALTPRTKAVIPVHLYGQVCEMDGILDFAKKHDLAVIEDAAQAHGAGWNGKRAGGFGNAACFSFYPGKNLGAMGDAGAVVGNDPGLIEKVRMLANHGRREKYTHNVPGYNSRMDAIQAAVLREKLKHLDRWNSARRRLAGLYIDGLAGADVRLQTVPEGGDPVWHLFVIRCRERDRLREKLKSAGFETGVHYPLPLHLQPAYLGKVPGGGSLPITEKAAGEVLSLPMYPELEEDAVARICGVIRDA